MRASSVKGDSYADRVQKLGNLADYPLTLVAESPVARHFSEAFSNGSSWELRTGGNR